MLSEPTWQLWLTILTPGADRDRARRRPAIRRSAGLRRAGPGQPAVLGAPPRAKPRLAGGRAGAARPGRADGPGHAARPLSGAAGARPLHGLGLRADALSRRLRAARPTRAGGAPGRRRGGVR